MYEQIEESSFFTALIIDEYVCRKISNNLMLAQGACAVCWVMCYNVLRNASVCTASLVTSSCTPMHSSHQFQRLHNTTAIFCLSFPSSSTSSTSPSLSSCFSLSLFSSLYSSFFSLLCYFSHLPLPPSYSLLSFLT